MAHPGGRPPKYETVEELESVLAKYFKETPMEQWTVTGLALHLGFTSRAALLNYQEKPEFVNAVKEAKLMVEWAYEMALRAKGGAPEIFALKNFGWRDQQQLEHSGSMTFSDFARQKEKELSSET
jgi:hypothetical protein